MIKRQRLYLKNSNFLYTLAIEISSSFDCVEISRAKILRKGLVTCQLKYTNKQQHKQNLMKKKAKNRAIIFNFQHLLSVIQRRIIIVFTKVNLFVSFGSWWVFIKRISRSWGSCNQVPPWMIIPDKDPSFQSFNIKATVREISERWDLTWE